MVGDPGIEPGVRLREGVTVLKKHNTYSLIVDFGPKGIAEKSESLGPEYFSTRGSRSDEGDSHGFAIRLLSWFLTKIL